MESLRPQFSLQVTPHISREFEKKTFRGSFQDAGHEKRYIRAPFFVSTRKR